MTQKITQLAISDGGVGATNIADQSIDFSKLNPVVGGLSFRNKIINGKMEIAQRGTSFAAIANSAYLAWLAEGNTPEPADPLPEPEPPQDPLEKLRAFLAANPDVQAIL